MHVRSPLTIGHVAIRARPRWQGQNLGGAGRAVAKYVLRGQGSPRTTIMPASWSGLTFRVNIVAMLLACSFASALGCVDMRTSLGLECVSIVGRVMTVRPLRYGYEVDDQFAAHQWMLSREEDSF